METLERWLGRRPLLITLGLALVFCVALSTNGVVSENVIPFGDGEHYALRALTLYGYLHSGQWAQFWDVFTLPKQSLAPIHYWFFFLVPQAWASMTSYGVVMMVTTYGLLGWGVARLCRALDRASWAPALFILCATQNISLDYCYAYFADVPFFAMGVMSMALQVQAWREPGVRNSVLSGLGAGLMFWVKPPNAVIFTATYLLAEAVRAGMTWYAMRKLPAALEGERAMWRKSLLRHLVHAVAGFVPVTVLAMACGGVQSIARLIDANELSGYLMTTLQCTGLLRLLYFPLCLTFFYHAVAMGLIFGSVILVTYKMNTAPFAPASVGAKVLPGPAFPAGLLVPLVVAYVVLGEFFSFGALNKEMRSLLLVLPVLWLGVFWGLEHWRVRPGLVFVAGLAYALCGFSQLYFDAFGTLHIDSESYQLDGDWLGRMPAPQFYARHGKVMAVSLLGIVQEVLPERGKIAVGTEMQDFTSESLVWVAQRDLALQGRTSPYRFENFLTAKGEYCRAALRDASGIILIVHPKFQYTLENNKAAVDLANFSTLTLEPNGWVKMLPIATDPDGVIGTMIVPLKPLTDEQITDLINQTHAVELPPNVEFNVPPANRLSWAQCWEIVERWVEKRLGWTAD